MIDTHCHLNIEPLQSKVDTIIKEASVSGIKQIIVPGIDISSSLHATIIADQYENIYAAVGVHPSEATQDTQGLMKDIRHLSQHRKVVAFGETGLDNKYAEKVPLTIQTKLFIEHIQHAIEHQKSLIIHCREAADQLLTILENNWNDRLIGKTVFHCCEPNEKLLEFAKLHSIYIGVDGDVTYNKEKQNFIKKVSLEMLVLETDSPYLTPEPVRSQKKFPNEPTNLVFTAQRLAELHKKSYEEILFITTNNARTLFNLS